MSITKEKTLGSFQINKNELLEAQPYSKFIEILKFEISEENHESFFKTMDDLIDQYKIKGNGCVNLDENQIYIFEAPLELFEGFIFIKETITDQVYYIKNNKVLH